MIVDVSDELAAAFEVLLAGQRWKRDALCVEYPDVEFFGERGWSGTEAKAVCVRCMVRDDCLEYAVNEDITHGVWGGLTGRERKAWKREAA